MIGAFIECMDVHLAKSLDSSVEHVFLVIFGDDDCRSTGGNICTKIWLQAQSYPKYFEAM